MAAYGTMDAAILGMPYGLDFKVESYPAEANMTPGRPVYQTPGSPDKVHTTYASGDVFIGIALFEQRGSKTTVGYYEQYDVVNVLTEGFVYVQAAAAVSGAPVAAYADSSGLFSPTASGNYDVGCMFRANQTTVSGLVLIEVNGPKLVA
jgi:hypothetical protein